MIRLIAGSLRGRKLMVPPESITRPTTDRVRETIFSTVTSLLLQDGRSFEGLRILDAFAGSGALGFEAISRGAGQVTFFDSNPHALKVIRFNRDQLGLEKSQVKTQRIDATTPPKAQYPMDIIFLDPPYNKGLLKHALRPLVFKGWAAEYTYVVCETSEEETLPTIEDLDLLKEKTLGAIKISILKKQPA